MRLLTLFTALTSAATTSASPVQKALYDGQCFYPLPTPSFNLTAYLGTWYQVAGTPFGPTTGARCVAANYALNSNNTIRVLNTATHGLQSISIVGTATPAPPAYGAAGVLKVEFPGSPATPCEGPNYVVQEYCVDHAIVQTQNWSTLYILSRERRPAPVLVEAWIERAVELGSEEELIERFDQTGCGEE